MSAEAFVRGGLNNYIEVAGSIDELERIITEA
jgi:hypothetical protein